MSNTPSFQPSVEAAQKALGPGAKIVKRAHPMGAEGVRVSLSEVCARIRRGMEDPMVVAWARRMIHENGSPQTTKERAQVLLTQLRKRVSYVPDPVGVEFMAQPRELLCLDPENKVLCFRGGDCDELVIAYASLTLAVGIPTQIIGESFNDSKIAEHVLCAIQDTEADEWLHVDPSTPKPVGEWVRGTNEEWIDPLNPKISGATTLGGNFVGVGAIGRTGANGALGAGATPSSGTSGLAIVGAVAAAGAIGLLIYNITAASSGEPRRNPISRRAPMTLGPGRIDENATRILRERRTLRARNQGDFGSAVESAGHYARKLGRTLYVYSGNSYGHAIWRVTYKASDYGCRIGNTGAKVISVSPDLVVSYHEVEGR